MSSPRARRRRSPRCLDPAAPRAAAFRPGSARLAALVLGLCLAALPAAAPAAITEPPPSPKSVIVFPDRDFVSISGYGRNKDLAVRVLRNGVGIGAAEGRSDNAPAPDNGIFEVNHPGGVCWIGGAPDILPGDKVLVSATLGDPNADATTTGTSMPTRPSSNWIRPARPPAASS